MYIDRIICENTGPIKNIELSLRKENENPAPCVIVGENGSGKSILLSYIADSFFELAELGYNNATKRISSGHEYFKIVSGNHISVGSTYGVSYIEYSDHNDIITYCCKSGSCECEEFIDEHHLSKNTIHWKKNDNYKEVSITEDKSRKLFAENVICYFPPSRYEKPNWLGGNYYEVLFNSNDNYTGQLRNPIIVSNVTNDLLQWLFDIITDSRGDLEPYSGDGELKFRITYPSGYDIFMMSKARKNVEDIMSTILGEPVKFRMGYRNSGRKRFSICDAKGNTLVPSLDSLSTGQMALFLLFASIACYADHYDLNKSIYLDQIKGIVVIDEIDLHLHSKLQREVLPKLLKLFPKVQFVFSTHSPLVLMGLSEEYGDGIDIIEMPTGNHISVERFAEFENAYAYYTATEKYRFEFQKAIDRIRNEKPLIITEGATDWRHIRAAFNYLSNTEQFGWIKELDFELLEYDPENSDTDNSLKIQMSAEELVSMVKDYCKISQNRKMVFIADNDVPNVRNKLMDKGKKYKSWGNNVFSLTLPVPSFRENTPNICIEHLYQDSDIKKWVYDQDSKRRVFLGSEFNADGFYIGNDARYFCRDKNSCGESKIQIIDGSGNRKVIEPYGSNSETNYALTKMDFANKILAGEAPFDQMDFSGFIPLFEVLNEILNAE